MDSLNPFKLYDTVTATDETIQYAHSHGLKTPPTDVVVVVGVTGDHVHLSDASTWHYSHFEKVPAPEARWDKGEGQGAAVDPEELFASVEDRFASVAHIIDFNEFAILDELGAYIASTYNEHYAKGGVQAFALIAKRPQRGLHFALSNIIKYADRFGEKDGMNRKDLLKIAHYAVLAIYCCDEITEEEA